MRVLFTVFLLWLASGMATAAYAADLNWRDRPSSHEARLFVPRMRVVEQVPFCGDCDNLIGASPSSYVRLRFIGRPLWEQGCALGGCGEYYRTIRHCWPWGLESVCN
ncbi:MAG TPA: hypothetical protein VFP60_17695 [Pseudolabrys sp.]|nr:hypothetical protein [Pseudolabrys sp.]